MIAATRSYICESLLQAKNPSLLVSFGKESMLLLTLVREIKPDISLFWFGDKLSAFAESVIKDQDLQVFSYAPADRYIVGESLVDEYSLGNVRVPLISDLIIGEPCELERLPTIRTPQFNWRSDLTLWGYRQLDNHVLVHTTFPQRFPLGGTVMDAPLYNYTEAQVLDALDELGITYDPDTNATTVCQTCLDEIDATMDKEAALAGFQSRFQFSYSCIY
jgi:hypothetical protein